MESGYYPPGAQYDSNAPYNQVEIEEKPFDVVISQSLSKKEVVYTDKYTKNKAWIDDGEHGYYEDEIDTEDVNWVEEYTSQHLTPLQLIEELNKICQKMYKGEEYTKGHLMYLMREAEEWIEDDIEIVKE